MTPPPPSPNICRSMVMEKLETCGAGLVLMDRKQSEGREWVRRSVIGVENQEPSNHDLIPPRMSTPGPESQGQSPTTIPPKSITIYTCFDSLTAALKHVRPRPLSCAASGPLLESKVLEARPSKPAKATLASPSFISESAKTFSQISY